MKRYLILFSSFIFSLFLLASRVSASSQQAHTDYLYQYDVYRQTYNDFKVAKNEYEKFRSLVSQTQALDQTKKMLTQRDVLLRSYLLLLNEKLNENKGLDAPDRSLYQTLIQNEVKFLESHATLIPAIGSIDDTVDVSKQLESHYNILQTSIRQAIIALGLGELTNYLRTFDTLYVQAQKLVQSNSAIILPVTQTILERWMLQINDKKTLYQQKIDSISETNARLTGSDISDIDKSFQQMQKDMAGAKQYLVEATSYVEELINALRYAD